MKVGKPKSKRVPVRLRHKIEKASAAKQRKQRKLAKKNPEWRSRLKKDPGIPNLFPYKDKILQEIEESRRRKEEDVQRRRDEARARRVGEKVKDDAGMDDAVLADDEEALIDYEDEEESEDEEMAQDDTTNPMAALLASARARASEYDHTTADDDDNEGMDVASNTSSPSWSGVASPTESDTFGATPATHKDTSRRAHGKAFKQVLSSSDVILYVLDARDPLSTRSTSIEQAITASPSKRLVLILNKIDLVPAGVLKSWLIHLRRSFPTLPLRASSSAPNAKTFDHKHLTPQFTANILVKALKSYAASSGLHRAITVGIIGYPNVGKSSVINALTSRLSGRAPSSRSHKDCPVGAEAGVTTTLREVKLDGKIKLIDSPGIVFPSSSSDPNPSTSTSIITKDPDEQAKLILLNAIPPREIDDPMPAVSLLLRRLSASSDLFARLCDVYGLPALMRSGEGQGGRDVTTDFLVQVARKRGRLGKGGVPNLHAAAQTVVSDWRDGRIQGWVEAPVAGAPGGLGGVAGEAKDRKEIVAEWAKEFKIEGLWGDGGEERDGDAKEDMPALGGDVVMISA